MDTGKVLDTRAMSRFCKQCKEHEDDEETPENIAWKIDYKSKCKVNFKGSAPAMEPEVPCGSSSAQWKQTSFATQNILGMVTVRVMVLCKKSTILVMMVSLY